jgi:hypothetical protein
MLGMVMPSMIVLLGRFAIGVVVPMIVPMIVVVIMSRTLGTGSLLRSSLFRSIASHPDRDAQNQGQCDPFRDFHSEFS